MKPLNSIFLQIDTPLQKEIISGTLRLIAAPEYNPEQNATVVGKIAALPKYPKGEYAAIVKDLKIGDDIAFLYSVCSKIGYYGDSNAFHPATDGSDYYKVWYNGKGERLQILAVPGIITKRWFCTYMDKRNNLIDGVDGTERDMEKFLSQFTFGSSDKAYFKNLVEINGKTYWRAEFNEILAVKRKKDIVAVGDWVCCNPIMIDQTTTYNLQHGTILPPKSIGFVLTDRAEVVSSKVFKKKQVIGANEQYWNKYTLWDEPFYFIKERRVYGTFQKLGKSPID